MAKKKSKRDQKLKDRKDLPAQGPAVRKSFAEVMAEEVDQSWILPVVEIEESKYPRIYTRLIDIDLFFAPAVGSRIEIAGPASNGKSTLCYIMVGTLLRTCKKCLTMAVDWVDDDTGEIQSVCKCRKNDLMEGVIADTEKSAGDAIWLNRWGCRVGTGFKTHTHPSGGFEILEPDEERPRLHILRPIVGGAMYAFLQKALSDGAVDFAVIDCLNSLLPGEVMDKEAGSRSPGANARMHWDGLRRMVSSQLAQLNRFKGQATIIWTNHLISNIGAQWDKETEAGGGAPKLESDQKLRLVYSKTNDGKKELEFDCYRDTYFRVTKGKKGAASGAEGSFRLYLNEVKHNNVICMPGDTDDPDKIYAFLTEIGLCEDKKSKYVVLGREFKRVQDVKAFLSREDIRMECRFWIGAIKMSTMGRAYLNYENYCYSPFESARRHYDAMLEILEKKIPGIRPGSAIEDPVGSSDGVEGTAGKDDRVHEGSGKDGGAVFDELLGGEPTRRKKPRKGPRA